MSDKPSEISNLTDQELDFELRYVRDLINLSSTATAALLSGWVEPPPKTPYNGDPSAAVLALMERRDILVLENVRRKSAASSADSDTSTVGRLASRQYFPPASEMTLTTPARPGKVSILAEGRNTKPKRVDIFLTGELEMK